MRHFKKGAENELPVFYRNQNAQ
jgi:hypothetical protein